MHSFCPIRSTNGSDKIICISDQVKGYYGNLEIDGKDRFVDIGKIPILQLEKNQ